MNIKGLFLLFLTLLLIFIVLPQTFAYDVDNVVIADNIEANDNAVEISNDVNVSANGDYWYESKPTPESSEVTYNGGNVNIEFITQIDDYFAREDSPRYFGALNLYVYVNDDTSSRVQLSGYDGASSVIDVNLNLIKNQLKDGENKITVHPDVGQMISFTCSQYNFISATVFYNTAGYDYITTPHPSNVDYVLGDNKTITVSADYNSSYLEHLSNSAMYVYINGENESNRVVISNVNGSSNEFSFNLKDIKDKLTMEYNDLTFHPDLDGVISSCLFNKLTVRIVEPIYDYYISNPDPADVENYNRNTDEIITINTYYYEGISDVMGWLTMCVYINEFDGQNWDFIRGVQANETEFTFNLKDISSRLSDGNNKLWFAPYLKDFYNVFEGKNYTFNPLTVNVKKSPTVNGYISTPTPSEVYYKPDTSSLVTVNVKYPNNIDISGSKVFVYINGEDAANRVTVDNVDSGDTSFTFDLASISDKLISGVNNLTFHPNRGMLEYYIYGDLTFNPLTVILVNEIQDTILNVDSTLNVEINKSQRINATYSPNSAKITYLSNDESIAIVNENGIIMGVKEGIVNITIIVGDNDLFKISKANVTVYVLNQSEEYNGIIYLSKKGDDKNCGSYDNPVASISKAIELASSDNNVAHKIIIDKGTYDGFNLKITSDLIIIGENVVIDASDMGGILEITKSDVAISGITFANANECAISIINSSIDISDCIFINNKDIFTEIINACNSYLKLSNNKLDNSFIHVEDCEITSKTTLMIYSNATIKLGDNVTITAIMTDDNNNMIDGGVITLTADTTLIAKLNLVNATVSTIFTPDVTGNYSVSGTYDSASNVDVKNIVIQVIDVISKTDANMSAKSNDTHIIVTLPDDASGNITFIINNTVFAELSGGNTVKIPNLPSGNYTAIIVYSGDDKYNNDTTSVEFTIHKKQNVTLNISAEDIIEGENATIIIILPDDAKGNVSAVNSTVSLVNGTANIVIPGLSVGNNNLIVTYSGDDKYNPISKNVIITVNPKYAFIVEALNVEKYYGGSERFRVKVTDLEGKPVSGQLVVINIGERQYNKTTNVNGTVTAPLGLNSGLYNVTVKVNDTTVNSTALIKSTLEGCDVVMIYRNGTQYLATFKDSQGNLLAEGTQIQFNINGVLYERNVRSNGIARLNLNLEQGNYVITALNTKTGERCANNITIISNIIENRDITKYYRNGTQYTVKILGKDGNPIGRGVNVTFNINGVLYTRITNNQSIAKLNINLQPGDYVITTDYNGCKVSNKITVLPVLSAHDLNKVYRSQDQFIATLVDGQGNSLAGEKVSFNINGVLYERTTNANGQAKLNIKLQAGEYIITSSYNNLNIAKKVTVTT